MITLTKEKDIKVDIYYTMNYGSSTEVGIVIYHNNIPKLYKYQLDSGLWIYIQKRNIYWDKTGRHIKLSILSELRTFKMKFSICCNEEIIEEGNDRNIYYICSKCLKPTGIRKE